MYYYHLIVASLTLVSMALTMPSTASAQNSEGYYRFLRIDVNAGEQKISTWEGGTGNVKISQKGVLNPANNEIQTLTGKFTWPDPPRMLVVGQKVTLPLTATILIDSHPNKGFSWGAGAWAWFGWNASGPGNSFKEDSRYILSYSNYPNGLDSNLHVTTGAKTLNGVLEIPTSKGVELPVENGLHLVPIIVKVNCGNDYKQFKYVYSWHEGSPPPTTTSTPASSSVAGVWKHGPNGETWTLTPKGDGSYTAVEKGFDQARGTATVDGNRILIDYVASNGTTGKYQITLGANGRSGTGSWSDSTSASGTRDFVKVSDNATGAPPTSTPDAKQFTVVAARRQLNAGETVLLPVEIRQPAGVTNLNVTIEYENAVAKVSEKPAPGDLKQSRIFESNHAEAGIVRIGMAGSKGITADGQLAIIPFTATGKAGDRTPLKVTVTTANGEDGAPMIATTIDGELQIVQHIPGDTDGDGKVSMTDAMEALKMSVKLLPEDTKADMDTDGRVTSNDARLILSKALEN